MCLIRRLPTPPEITACNASASPATIHQLLSYCFIWIEEPSRTPSCLTTYVSTRELQSRSLQHISRTLHLLKALAIHGDIQC